MQTHIRTYDEEFAEFPIDFGVLQGCPSSLVLFDYAIDWIMHRALNDLREIQLCKYSWATDLELAEDVVILLKESATV